MKMILALLLVVGALFGCSSKNVKAELERNLKEDLKIQIESLKPLTSYDTLKVKKVVGDSIVMVDDIDTVEIGVKELLIDNPNYKIRRYEMVSGTLITKLAIVDFHYLRPEKFDVFQRRVYRYNESIKGWEIHKKYMLKNSLIDDDLEKYLKLQ